MASQTVLQAVPFPQPAREVSQAQLKNIISLRNSFAALKSELEAAEVEVKAALESGVPVEPGLHIAALQEHFRRSIAWREVSGRLAERLYGEGRGEAYCENVLQNTHPTRSVELKVS